jgi:SWIM zinc finger
MMLSIGSRRYALRLAVLYAPVKRENISMLIEQQIAERRDRAIATQLRVLKRPATGPYGDYTVKSASGRTYRVALRGPGRFENYCSCPDFAVNTLGTCKHIEAMLSKLRQRHRKALETAAYTRTRASISLQ